MEYKRILTIQDISCVGQCSMTVAMPILSACGHETCILPTAMLSTHTGGFGAPAIFRFENGLEEFWRHWQRNGITFDAILVGYLGSVSAVETAIDIIRELLAPGGIAVVDPVMADNGKLYSGFDDDYVAHMKRLCSQASVILPNITEAALMSGVPYQEIMDEDYVNSLLCQLDHPCVALTGVGYAPDQTGVVLQQQGSRYYHSQPRLGGSFHGTGDMFAACFTGSLMSGKNLEESVVFAASFTEKAIRNTIESPAHWYGVKFEPLLCELKDMLSR